MTVQQLIDKLKEFDPDIEVVFTNTGFGHAPVDGVYTIQGGLTDGWIYKVVLS